MGDVVEEGVAGEDGVRAGSTGFAGIALETRCRRTCSELAVGAEADDDLRRSRSADPGMKSP